MMKYMKSQIWNLLIKKCNECDGKYIGQTKRIISTQFNEHFARFKYKGPEKSAIAAHYIERNDISV